MPKFSITMEASPEELGEFSSLEEAKANPKFLQSLCQKEVDRFERYCTAVDPNFQDGSGFVRIEARVLAGYLYQMVKGHVDAFDSGNLPPMEGQNG